MSAVRRPLFLIAQVVTWAMLTWASTIGSCLIVLSGAIGVASSIMVMLMIEAPRLAAIWLPVVNRKASASTASRGRLRGVVAGRDLSSRR